MNGIIDFSNYLIIFLKIFIVIFNVTTALGLETLADNRSLNYSDKSTHFGNIFGRKTTQFFDNDVLSQLLKISQTEFQNCFISVVFQSVYEESTVLQTLAELPNTKQFYNSESVEDLEKLKWKSSICQGYIFLLNSPDFFRTNSSSDFWNFKGRYIIVVPSKEHLENIFQTTIGNKTEHIVALVPSKNKNSQTKWSFYTQMFFPKATTKIPKQTIERSIFQDKFTDYQNTTIRVKTFDLRPLVFFGTKPDGTQYAFGRDIAIVKYLAESLNFNPQFSAPKNGEMWGSETEGGMMGALIEDEADVGAANCFISFTRELVIDYSYPYTESNTCFMDLEAQPIPRWQSVLRPFELVVWLFIFCIFLICVFIFALISFIQQKFSVNEIALDFSCVLIVLRAHMHESTSDNVKATSLRIFLVILVIYGLILTISYTSNLTASLTVTKLPPSMDTIAEAAESGKIVSSFSFFICAIESAADPHLRELSNRSFVVSPTEAINNVRLGRALFLSNKVEIEYLLSNKYSRPDGTSMFRIMKECFLSLQVAFYMQNNSPFKKSFDKHLSRIVESGLIRKAFTDSLVFAKQLQLQVKEDELPKSESHPGVAQISLNHLEGVFLFLILGHIWAIIVFTIEVVIGNKKIG